MASELPPLVEALIRRHRLRSHASPQDGLREIGACLLQLGVKDCGVVDFYAHYYRNTPENQVDYGRDLLAIEFDGRFYDTRSCGLENIARNFANYNIGGPGKVSIEVREGWGQAHIPTLEDGHPMLKTARAFMSEQQADLLSKSTCSAPSPSSRRPRM